MLLLIIGVFIGIIDAIALKFTIKLFIKKKEHYIILLSLFFRIIITTCLIFLLSQRNWKNILYVTFGITTAKILFAQQNKLRKS